MGWLEAWQVMSEFPLEVSHSGSSHEKSSFFRNQCKTWKDCMLEMSRVSVCRQYFACPKRSITFSPGLLSRMQNITLDIYEQHRAPQLCSTAVGKCQMLKQTHLPDSEAAELESRLFFHVFSGSFNLYSILRTGFAAAISQFPASRSLGCEGCRLATGIRRHGPWKLQVVKHPLHRKADKPWLKIFLPKELEYVL